MLLATPLAASTQDGPWQFGSATSFSSGRYGTDTRTEVLHTPVTARRLFEDGDVTFVFPFTCVWGDAGVTVLNGSPVRQQRLANSVAGSDATGVRGAAAARAGANAPSTRNCGVGDFVARGRYYVFDQRGWGPTVAVRAHAKAPTASAERGLGTGRPDAGAGLEISRTFAAGTMAIVDGGFTFIGSPAGVQYRNHWWYDMGVGQTLAGGAVNFTVLFEESRGIIPGLANARDVLAAASVAGGAKWRVQVAGELGLSEGAPDHGVTFGASRRF